MGAWVIHQPQNGDQVHNLCSLQLKCCPHSVQILLIVRKESLSLGDAKKSPSDQLVPDRVTAEKVGGAADAGLNQAESGLAIQEGQEHLHKVRVSPELLLCVALVAEEGHILECSVLSLKVFFLAVL